MPNDDNDVVHRTGDEVIGGIKTLVNQFNSTHQNTGMIIRHPTSIRGTNPSITKFWTISCCDSENSEYSSSGSHGRIGIFECYLDSEGKTCARMAAYKNEEDSDSVESLQIVYPLEGEPFALAPTISDFDNNGKAIATTAWVNNANCIVHRTGNETIAGEKTFESRFTNRSAYGLIIRHPDLIRGTIPSSGKYSTLSFCDKDNVEWSSDGKHGRFGCLETIANTNGSTRVSLHAYKNESNSNTGSQLAVFISNTGVASVDGVTNNAVLLGTSSVKWKEIWCTQSSINSSSDERLKDEISNFPDEVLDAWGEVNFQQFKFKDAIQEKGSTQARIHSGIIAQHIDRVFKNHNLEIRDYGLFLYDSWKEEPEEKDDDGNIIQKARPAGDSYGIRYTEALCMEAAYQRRRASRAEARITELEQRLNSLEEKLVGKD